VVIITGTDIETWNSKDFVKYVVQKLDERNIRYRVKYPFDIIVLGKLLKGFKKQGKTNYFARQKIDELFTTLNFENISSFRFLSVLIKTEKKEKGKVKKLKDEEILLSGELKQRLYNLKEKE